MVQLFVAAVFAGGLAFADEFPFVADESFESDGAAGVNFVGADTDLGAESS